MASVKKHPGALVVAGILIMFASLSFGNAAFFLIGLPALFISCGIAGGARRPSSIPTKDALIYIAISVALVIGTVLYAFYSR